MKYSWFHILLSTQNQANFMWFGVLQLLFCRVLLRTFCSRNTLVPFTPRPQDYFSPSRKLTGQHYWVSPAEGTITPPSILYHLNFSDPPPQKKKRFFRSSVPTHSLSDKVGRRGWPARKGQLHFPETAASAFLMGALSVRGCYRDFLLRKTKF